MAKLRINQHFAKLRKQFLKFEALDKIIEVFYNEVSITAIYFKNMALSFNRKFDNLVIISHKISGNFTEMFRVLSHRRK